MCRSLQGGRLPPDAGFALSRCTAQEEEAIRLYVKCITQQRDARRTRAAARSRWPAVDLKEYFPLP
jgi:hypothetical protein